MKEVIAGKKTHPLVDHFREVHNGSRQEILFRTIAQFQTALERQVWESVEIDSTTASIGLHCLNSKTEWGLSKDPALVNRGTPQKKTLARAQRQDQVAGNTSKRLATQPEDTRPTKRCRRVLRGEGEPDQGTHTTVPTDGPKPVALGLRKGDPRPFKQESKNRSCPTRGKEELQVRGILN